MRGQKVLRNQAQAFYENLGEGCSVPEARMRSGIHRSRDTAIINAAPDLAYAMLVKLARETVMWRQIDASARRWLLVALTAEGVKPSDRNKAAEVAYAVIGRSGINVADEAAKQDVAISDTERKELAERLMAPVVVPEKETEPA